MTHASRVSIMPQLCHAESRARLSRSREGEPAFERAILTASVRATTREIKMSSTDQTHQAYPVHLSVDYPDRSLNRLTTAFRVLVAIPILLLLETVSAGPFTPAQSGE